MLPATRDECRRVLRRLELEAYSYTVSALRAQGALRDEVRQTLAALRQTLHIGADRHQAEARRVCNDELLAAIAEQLAGPNTELEWVQEGRRKIPIMPRGVPQTIYTAIADQAAMDALAENENIVRRNKTRKTMLTNDTPDDVSSDQQIKNPDDVNGNVKLKSESDYPPIVTSDQSLKIKAEEGPPRKKSRPEMLVISHRVTHQKHPNLSQIYTSYSKSHSAKLSTSYSRNPYNQTGKVTTKSNHGLTKASLSKHRSLQKHGSNAKHCGQVAIPHHQVRSGIKSPTDPHIAGSQALSIQNQIDANTIKSQTPIYQANYAPNDSEEFNISDAKLPIGSTVVSDSPTMQLLAHSSSAEDAQNVQTSMHYSMANSNVSITVPTSAKIQSGKPCHLIIKKKTDGSADQKFQVTNKQLSKQDLSNIKVLQNRQVIVTPSNNNSQQKLLNSNAKLITTKIVQHIPQKSQSMDKVLIMPKSPMSPTLLQRNLSNTSLKNLFISTSGVTNVGEAEGGNKDSDLSKSVILNNSDVKLSTKTFLLNSKSGQKMVVVPAKRPKTLTGQAMPLLVKGVQGKPAAMKLVTVSGPASVNNQTKPANITVLSKSISSSVIGSPAKIISKDSLNQIKSNALNNEHTLPKALSHVQIPPKSMSQPVKHPSAKGNIIVVQKGSTLHKNQLPLSKATVDNFLNDKVTSASQLDAPRSLTMLSPTAQTENVVFLGMQKVDLYPDFMKEENSLTESKEDNKGESALIAEDTPIIFHSQLPEGCNADSMESTTDSLMEESHVQDNNESLPAEKTEDFCETEEETDKNASSRTAALSTFTDWEEESANMTTKDDSKTSELNLAMETSSDSEGENYTREMCKDKDMSQDESQFDEQDSSRLELLDSSQTSGSAME